MAWSKKYTGVDSVRLNKWLAENGICSRREADTLISRGLVTVNETAAVDLGYRLTEGDFVSVTSAGLAHLKKQITVILHKPVGYVSGQPEGNQIPAARLVSRENIHSSTPFLASLKRSFAPLGRLDQDSRGLLILSEDGVLARAVIGPESVLEKEYLVKVQGTITDKKIEKLQSGMSLDGKVLRPAKVVQINENVLRFILTEGRNRQIRRMSELVELEVVDLIRIRIGTIKLAGLPPSKWRLLTASERSSLLEDSRPRVKQ